MRSRVALGLVIAIALAPGARAQRVTTPAIPRVAVWRFDALGISPDLVARLETLFRRELDRLAGAPLLGRRDLERALPGELRACSGADRCLGDIARALGVDVVVTGTVGAMGDSYVLDVKAVDARGGLRARTQSDPLRGRPDELIEGVRVAAYKLLAPDQLHGAIRIATDLVGAEVRLDGRRVGTTPLRGERIDRVAIGVHELVVSAPGYARFAEDVDVRFQKVSEVVVRLLPAAVIGTGAVRRSEDRAIYTRPWFVVGVGIAAVALGGYLGYRANRVDCVRVIDGREGPC